MRDAQQGSGAVKLPLTESGVLAALRVVQDPDLHRDIVALNFIKNLTISGNAVSLTIELTTPACPVRDELKGQAVRAILEKVEGVGDVQVSMTSKVARHEHGMSSPLLAGVKNTIAVASGKGGVGKSTVAVNLAVGLAREGAAVGLVDLDLYGPSIPLMMGIQEKPVVQEQKLVPIERWGVRVMSIGFLVDPEQAIVWRGPMVSGAVRQFMSDVVWGDLDYLIMDLPPGTGDIQLTLVQTVPLTGAVVVTTPQDISLADAVKAWKMFNRVNVPVLGVVENMSYFICSHCGQREDVFDSGGGERVAKENNVPFLGAIPIYTDIRRSGDAGKPVAADDGSPEQTAIMRGIARNVAAQVSIRNALRTAPAVDIQIS